MQYTANYLFSISDASKHSGISRMTLHRWIKSGKLKRNRDNPALVSLEDIRKIATVDAKTRGRNLQLKKWRDSRKKRRAPSAARTNETSWIDAFGKASFVFQNVIDKRPVHEWSEIELESFIHRAQPFIDAVKQCQRFLKP